VGLAEINAGLVAGLYSVVVQWQIGSVSYWSWFAGVACIQSLPVKDGFGLVKVWVASIDRYVPFWPPAYVTD